MIRLLVARVNGYLCLSNREVAMAKAFIDPAPKPVAAPAAPTAPTSANAVDIRV
jgi:hypothetical protein